MKNIKGDTSIEIFVALFFLIIVMAGVAGYIVNFIEFVNLNFQPPYKAEVIRGLGIVSGVGAILGYINIQD